MSLSKTLNPSFMRDPLVREGYALPGLTRYGSGPPWPRALGHWKQREPRDRELVGDVDQTLEAHRRAKAVDERRERVEARPAFDLGVHCKDVQVFLVE